MPSRRAFLAALGSATSVGLAGCTTLDRPVTGRFPGAGIDAANTGHAPETDGPDTPRVRWQDSVGAWLGATPVVAAETVYLPYPVEGGDRGEHEARLGAWDATTGQRTWSATTGTVTVDSTFEIARDSLVHHGDALYLVDATGFHSFTLDGSRRWHTPIPGRQTNPAVNPAHPAVDGDTAYFGTAGIVDAAHEGVFAVSTDDGAIQWNELVPFEWTTAGAGTRMVFGPAFGSDTVYAGVLGNGVLALDAAVGQRRWRTPLPVNGPPTVLPGGDVVVHLEWRPSGADDAHSGVARLDGRTGEVVWRVSEPGGARSGVQLATDGDLIYYCAAHRSLRARRVEDGRVAWDSDAVEWVSPGAPVVTADRVWTGVNVQQSPAFDGVAILEVDRATGDSTIHAPFREDFTITSSLALVDDALYLAADGATLWAFDDCRLTLGDDCLVH